MRPKPGVSGRCDPPKSLSLRPRAQVQTRRPRMTSSWYESEVRSTFRVLAIGSGGQGVLCSVPRSISSLRVAW